MLRPLILLVSLLVTLAACAAPPTAPQLGPDGKPLPQLYRITTEDERRIPFEMLDSVNALRDARGAPPVRLDEELTAAAATHARDMSVQNRPWHFGSDGSSPIERVQRVGYAGRFRGETISETYETEVETLAAWMDEEPTRTVILDPQADEMGIAWHQEPNGKIWWTMVFGASGSGEVPQG
ncbi:CAP domain-containing protein [Rhodosalinus sp.]|uniref:CAP domain-containing protein n=1 Tax=Rhodosalinus sp. TaxID=2047741 RepID=UPI00356AB12D